MMSRAFHARIVTGVIRANRNENNNLHSVLSEESVKSGERGEEKEKMWE